MEKESFNRHLKLLQKILYSREKSKIFRVDLKENFDINDSLATIRN